MRGKCLQLIIHNFKRFKWPRLCIVKLYTCGAFFRKFDEIYANDHYCARIHVLNCLFLVYTCKSIYFKKINNFVGGLINAAAKVVAIALKEKKKMIKFAEN